MGNVSLINLFCGNGKGKMSNMSDEYIADVVESEDNLCDNGTRDEISKQGATGCCVRKEWSALT